MTSELPVRTASASPSPLFSSLFSPRPTPPSGTPGICLRLLPSPPTTKSTTRSRRQGLLGRVASDPGLEHWVRFPPEEGRGDLSGKVSSRAVGCGHLRGWRWGSTGVLQSPGRARSQLRQRGAVTEHSGSPARAGLRFRKPLGLPGGCRLGSRLREVRPQAVTMEPSHPPLGMAAGRCAEGWLTGSG